MKNQKEKMLKKEESIRKSDVVTNRLYISFFASVLLIFGIVRLSNSIDFQLRFVDSVRPICVIALGALLIAAIVYKFICFRKGKDESFSTFSSSFLLVIAASLFAVVALYGNIVSSRLLALVIIATVLFFIYNIYDREFFWYSLYTAVSYTVFSLDFSLVDGKLPVRQVLVAAAAIVMALAVVFVVAISKQRRGKVVLFGKTLGKVSEKGAFSFFITSALVIAAMVLALFIPGIAAYSSTVLFVSYLIFAVIYTVKMM